MRTTTKTLITGVALAACFGGSAAAAQGPEAHASLKHGDCSHAPNPALCVAYTACDRIHVGGTGRQRHHALERIKACKRAALKKFNQPVPQYLQPTPQQTIPVTPPGVPNMDMNAQPSVGLMRGPSSQIVYYSPHNYGSGTAPAAYLDVSVNPASATVSPVSTDRGTCTQTAPGGIHCDLGDIAASDEARVQIRLTSRCMGAFHILGATGSAVPDSDGNNGSDFTILTTECG